MTTARLRDVAELNPPSRKFEALGPNEPIPFVPMEGVRLSGLVFEDRVKSEVATGFTRFENGDVLIPKIAPSFSHGRVVVVHDLPDGVAAGTTELHVLRPRPGVLAGWLRYVALSARFLREGESTYYGVAGQKRISVEWLKSFRVSCPAASEQNAIVDYLDRESARIDELIAEQQRFSALTTERFAATLEAAVWGAAPATQPLQQLVDVGRPITYGIVLTGPAQEEGVRFVEAGSVTTGALDLQSLRRTTPEIESEYTRARLRANDITIAIRGSVGKTALVPALDEPLNMSRDAARIAPTVGKADPLWLLYVVRTQHVQDQIGAGSLGSAVRGINIRDLRRARVPVLPIEQQRSVGQRLYGLDDVVTRLRTETSSQVTMLKEHKQALITAVVAGQKGVA